MRDILALSKAQEEIFLPDEDRNPIPEGSNKLEQRRESLLALIGRVATATNIHFKRRFGEEDGGIFDVEGTSMWPINRADENSNQIDVHRIRERGRPYSAFSVCLRPALGEFEWQQDLDFSVRQKVDKSREPIAYFATDRDGNPTIMLHPASEEGERDKVELSTNSPDSKFDRYLPQAEQVVAAVEQALPPRLKQ